MTSTNLETIWEQYCCHLLIFIRGRVSDESQAEDILQDVFIRVHHHLCCLPPQAKMESWIYQIARNLIIDYYRKRREVLELPSDIPVEMESPVFNAEASLAGSLKEMIDELPEPYREALIRALIDGGMSQGAAMAFMISGAGTSVGAIAGALTIARWRVIAVVVVTLWVGSIVFGYLFNMALSLRWI